MHPEQIFVECSYFILPAYLIIQHSRLRIFVCFLLIYMPHTQQRRLLQIFFTWYLILNILQTQLQKEHLPRGASTRRVIAWKWDTERKRDTGRTCRRHSQRSDKVKTFCFGILSSHISLDNEIKQRQTDSQTGEGKGKVIGVSLN